MFDKEDIQNTEKLNKLLGMDHRSKPYDLNNADDLKHALMMTTAAYMDYTHYLHTLYQLEEDFDESVEHFDTATWINMGLHPEKTDDLIDRCVAMLSRAVKPFLELADRTEKDCAFIIRAILSTPPATQKAVLGQAYTIEPEDRNLRIEELFEALHEEPYHQAIPDNLDTVISLMKELWAAFV